MSDFKRRDFLKTAAGIAAGTALGTGSIILPGEAAAQTYKAAPEKGAKLRVLRWKRFVQGGEDVWAEYTKKFTAAPGIAASALAVSSADVGPEAAGAGYPRLESAAVARLGARRETRRRHHQARRQQPGNNRRARIPEAALRDVHPGHLVLARPEQKQGFPRRPTLSHRQRDLDVLRGEDIA